MVISGFLEEEGGTILPTEIAELQDYGIARIYSPDDGMEMGLQGMINDVLMKCDFPTTQLSMKFFSHQITGSEDFETDAENGCTSN